MLSRREEKSSETDVCVIFFKRVRKTRRYDSVLPSTRFWQEERKKNRTSERERQREWREGERTIVRMLYCLLMHSVLDSVFLNVKSVFLFLSPSKLFLSSLSLSYLCSSVSLSLSFSYSHYSSSLPSFRVTSFAKSRSSKT